ncbi:MULTISPECIES: YaaC family protein [Achromobacter]|uniref:YaaC family protein n=1 Tax=Achromobacter TaxID=222 RepID=UPI0025B86514|nr:MULTISPECIES: YaaC family protein [Achromobacter]
MPRPPEKCDLALYQYNKLRFSFVDLDAGEQQILTSDPWSFLSSNLQGRLDKSRGSNRQKIERALYFASLAEDFYRAAENVPLPAKGTLLYYGMLDLVKVFLCLNGVPLETKPEHHGLILPIGKTLKVEARPPMRDAINVFAHFCELLGKPVQRAAEIDFQHALSHIPEVHGIYTGLGHIRKRKLLPVSVEFQVSAARDRLFTEIIYDKEHEAKVETRRFLTGSREKYFREGFPRSGKIVYRAARRKAYTRENIHRIYRNIHSEYRKFDIVPILTSHGYRYYVDLRPGELPHLGYAMLVMFYLGSAARYRPLEVKSLLQGSLRPLVSEFVSLTPRQFLYQIVSIITKKECVIPFSSV